MDNLLSVAIQAATDAGTYIARSASEIGQLNIIEKSLHDYVSEVDRNAEKIIRSHILKEFPSHTILGEEYGSGGGSDTDYKWIVDPLDGTTNFLRSIPHYAVSIGIAYNNELTIGVVYDPAKDDLFYAQKGKGAFLNKTKILVSQKPSIQGALLATGVPFNGKNLEEISSFTSTMEGLLAFHTSGIRRLGAAALDLAYIACGRYDGFWEANLQPWDIAAGALLVTEAGGIVSDLNGGDEYLTSGNILAANQCVHKPMLSITNKYY